MVDEDLSVCDEDKTNVLCIKGHGEDKSVVQR